ncbi:MAG: flippase [Spirochaetales bacterium]|nr:flippase [Spirochaetales bacterium]
MSSVRKVLKNFISLSASYIVTSLFGFFATIYLAQNLGAAGFGKISFAYSFLVYFMMLANPGLDRLGIRILARDAGKLKQAGTLVTLRFMLALISFLLLVLIAFILPKPSDVRILIIIYGISLFTYALLLEWVYQGVEKMGFVSVSRTLDKMLYFILIILFIENQNQILFVPVFWLAGSLAASLFLLIVFLVKYGGLRLSCDLSAFKGFLKQAVPIGLSYFVTQLFFHFDIIMLGMLKTEKEVGIYQASSKIIQLVLPWFNLFFIVIFPVLTRLYKESKEKITSLIRIILKYFIIICFPLITMGTVTANDIIRFLFGSEYIEGVLVFQILLWTLACFLISYSFMNLLLACDRERKLLAGMSIGTLTNIVFNIILIPLYGIHGAAVATITGSFVMLVYMYYESRKIMKVPFLTNIPLPFISALATIVVIYLFNITHIALVLLIGIGGYFSLLFLLRCITLKEIRDIKTKLRGR